MADQDCIIPASWLALSFALPPHAPSTPTRLKLDVPLLPLIIALEWSLRDSSSICERATLLLLVLVMLASSSSSPDSRQAKIAKPTGQCDI
ncbi:hypothetical protein IF1G_01464 [Cordyceps javanica]|uniref:Uncharacterized protein n=1 Tax=Cordyceps javanica TaxID=43265 RepID=A0A545VCB0_9HYPO|nr:hypothetical protein IF1G_01464 [Cordyceps javanica]